MKLIKKLMMWAGYIKKALAAASSALIITGTALDDSVVTRSEWTMIVAAWVAVFAVFQLSNKKPDEQ
jgi:hypothetical protein